MARSSQVADMERLKTEFNEKKREIKEQNEAELENLRRYRRHTQTLTKCILKFIVTVMCLIYCLEDKLIPE